MSLESRKTAQLEDPGAVLLDRVQSLWSRFGRLALGVLGGIVVIGVGFYFTSQANERRENEASVRLAEANNLFWQGDYDRSLTMSEEISKQYGGTRSGTDALRIAGDNAYWKGDWKASIAHYRNYLAKNSTGLVADAVRRSLAYAYESDGQLGEAVKLYDQLIGRFERESSAEFLFAASRCYEAMGKRDEALKRVQRIVNEFGETSYAMQARVRVAELGPLPVLR